MTLNDLERPK